MLAACRPAAPAEPAAEPVAQPAVDPLEHALLDGQGQPIDLAAFVTAAGDADVFAFGEVHGHPVGARFELELLEALAAGDRPVALAMEFF
jgi:uncharacterized iron-regulated protein